MTDEIKTLSDQKAALEAQIAEAQRKAKTANIIRVKMLMADHGITVADLAGRKAPKRTTKSAYVSTTGQAWCGLGRRPEWLQSALASGANLADFKVAA